MNRKVFDLELLSKSLGNPVEGQTIRTLHGTGNLVFVGGSQGAVVSYSVSEIPETRESVCEEWARQTLPSKQPIEQMESASALDRLFVLSDFALHFLRLQDLSILGTAKFKGITCFDINWNPSGDDAFVTQIALGTKRRQILLCDVSTEMMQVKREITTEGIPECLGYDGSCIFYSTDIHYYAYNTQRNSQQPLFPINGDEVRPLVRRIDKEEFLLMGMEGLGVFADGDGVSHRPPLALGSDPIFALAYLYPYVIALTEQSITVHSVLDQGLKQLVPFTNGCFIGNFDGQLTLATKTQLFRLSPVSWEQQIDVLLEEKKVEEAMEVVRSAAKSGTLKSDHAHIVRRIQSQAGFIELEQGNWNEAQNLFLESQLDPRELITLYPDILPESCDFTRHIPSLHNIPSIETLTRGSQEERKLSWQFLSSYLEEAHRLFPDSPLKKEILSALVKIRAKNGEVEELEGLLESLQASDIDVQDVTEWLREKGHLYAQSCVAYLGGNLSEALELWKKLESGEAEDSMYPGVDYVASALAKLESGRHLLDFGKWLYRSNRNSGMKVLMLLAGRGEGEVEDVIESVPMDAPDLLTFLEQVVLRENSKCEKFHTRLALTYSEVLKSSEPPSPEMRENFRKFLTSSDVYRTHYVLSKLQSEPQFKKETAFVMGKLGDHEGALNLLAGQIKDYDTAEEYCAMYSKDSKGQPLHQTLFRIYVRAQESSDLPVSRIVNLLQRPDLVLNPVEVLESLPNHWSFSVIKNFVIRSSIRQSAKSRFKSLGSELGRSAAIGAKLNLQGVKQTHWSISEESRCFVCKDVFIDPEGQRLPDGSIAHLNCFRRHQ